MQKTAVYLDSDGFLNNVIIRDGKPFAPTTLETFVIPLEVKPAVETLKALGFMLICVTKRSWNIKYHGKTV